MICPSCREESYTYAELGDGGTVDHCGSCHSIIPRDEPTQRPPRAVDVPRPVAPVTAPTSGIRKIIDDAKARLAEIELKIADVEALLNEASALRAMIAAAEPRPSVKAA